MTFQITRRASSNTAANSATTNSRSPASQPAYSNIQSFPEFIASNLTYVAVSLKNATVQPPLPILQYEASFIERTTSTTNVSNPSVRLATMETSPNPKNEGDNSTRNNQQQDNQIQQQYLQTKPHTWHSIMTTSLLTLWLGAANVVLSNNRLKILRDKT